MKINDYEKQHLAAIREGLAECMVLLKKDGKFPLDGPCKIAAYGAGVRGTIKGGTGSGEVNSRFYINVAQGLSDAGFEITTLNWLNQFDQVMEQAKKDFVIEIKKRAKEKHTLAVVEGMGATMDSPEYDLPLNEEGDAAIYVVSRICGEGNDRSDKDLNLNSSEIRDILALNEKYDKFMLVLNVGGVVDLTPVKDVKNILIMSQLGVEMGAALADVLLGKESPSGKLTTTWAGVDEYCKEGEFGDWDDTAYKEGIYVGYRYFDSQGMKPLFPFGFGLNYGEMEVNAAGFSLEGSTVKVKAHVANNGKFATKEVAQVYVSAPEVELDQPYQVLAGFNKTAKIEPGKSTDVEVSFDLASIASYNTAKHAYVLEPGDYLVSVGNSSDNTMPAGIVRVEKEVVTRLVRNAYGEVNFEDAKLNKVKGLERKDEFAGALVAVLSEDAINTEVIDYTDDKDIDERVKSLSDADLIKLSLGHMTEGGGMSVIGQASNNVVGAAGESGHVDGFPFAVMADGPAGLRLAKNFYDDNGTLRAVGGNSIESMEAFLPAVVKWLSKMTEKKPKEGQEVKEQYCTAIPIGTAIAQSFNLEFAKVCGDIVGEEMERFGVHLWLAPALNIHRDIRCGRNFEYFSEDPLVSGKFAAAITDGVQAHKGCGTTIKHYAANNQEKNRYANDSQVSERALREIYLRGFEICVKEAQPYTIMSSYNLLNGVHTNERRDLIEYTLRNEWGYKGFVMTDWIVGQDMMCKGSKNPLCQARKITISGNEVIMPATKKELKDLQSALASGELTREALMINATRVIRTLESMGVSAK